ncbi:MAG: hypothetical protein KBA61_08190 [Spirochaetes bacterium]|nr:hypothetical protein [Spirochaetota bacterium]
MGLIAYALRNLRMELRDLSGRIVRVMVASFGILFLIAFLAVFLSLRAAAGSYIEKRIFGRLDINEIQVTPPAVSDRAGLNLFAPTSNDIPEAKVRAVRRIAGIKNIHRVIRLNAPAMLRAGMFNIQMRTDILVSGVESEFFRGTDIDWRRFAPAERLPVVIPYFALDLYNNFAAVNGLPELGKKALTGFLMELSLGKSSFNRAGREDLFPAKVAGFSDRLSSTGIVVPSEFIRRYCRDHAEATYSTIMLHLTSASPADLPRVVDSLKALDLRVQSRRDIAEKTSRALGIIDGTFSLVLVIILVLTVVAIVNSYLAVVYNRGQEIALKRIVGQSKFRVILSFTAEAAAVGAFFGAAGLLMGNACITHLSSYLPKWVPLLAGLELVPLPGRYLPPAALAAAAVSAASALVPAVIASNMNLFKSTKV